MTVEARKVQVFAIGPLLRMACMAVFWLCLVLGLLDYGAVRPEVRAVLACIIYAVLAVAAVGSGLPIHVRGLICAATGLLLAVFALIWLQSSPGVGLLPAYPLWAEAQPFFSKAMANTVSLAPADDRFAMLTVALPFGFFLAGLVLFDTDERALRALRGMTVAGGIIALLSLLQFVFQPKMLLFGEKRYYLDSLTGVFVNRNTAATFFGLVVLALYTQLWRRLEGVNLLHFFRQVLENDRSPGSGRTVVDRVAVDLLLLVVTLAALALTQSRGGIGSTVFALVLLTVLLGWNKPAHDKGSGAGLSRQIRRRLLLVGIPAGLILLSFLLLSGRAMIRAATGTTDARFCFVSGVWDTAMEHFPWGTGLAGFADAYAPHADPLCGLDAVLTQAHNVYLEGMVTLGVAFLPMLAVFFAVLTLVFRRGIRNRRRYHFAGKLGFAILALVAAHSLVDFSVQIPGFSMSLAALLAPLCTLCLRPSGAIIRPRGAEGDG